MTQRAVIVLCTSVVIFLCSCVALTLSACGGAAADLMDDAACQRLLDTTETLDAFDWLKTRTSLTKRPGTMSLDEALALAHRLELAGATRVVAVGLAKVDGEEHSRGVVVALPDEPAKRLAVFRVYAKLLTDYGGMPRADTGQKFLFVPWTGASASR